MSHDSTTRTYGVLQARQREEWVLYYCCRFSFDFFGAILYLRKYWMRQSQSWIHSGVSLESLMHFASTQVTEYYVSYCIHDWLTRKLQSIVDLCVLAGWLASFLSFPSPSFIFSFRLTLHLEVLDSLALLYLEERHMIRYMVLLYDVTNDVKCKSQRKYSYTSAGRCRDNIF